MDRWWVYVRERSPIPALLFVGACQSLSAFYLSRSGRVDIIAVAASTVGIAALFVLMRMMDEVKDEAKDRIAHPERPLPRGLLSSSELTTAVYVVGLLLASYALVVGAALSPLAGVLYAGTVGYAFLMFREFFIPRLLNSNAFVYAVSHQVIVIPMYAFAVAASARAVTITDRTLWFALTGLGASFAYEICRKLDPVALPMLGTYLRLYGRGATVAAVGAGLALLSLSAYRIDVHLIVWPAAALLLAVLPMVYVSPRRYRLVESVATLLGLVQMLAPTLHHFLLAHA
ncbi:MAG: hypothetical protein NVS1B4_23120 [Gemmatimonadaceae bacterium]